MAKRCPHCGETSDADNICTWCSRSLVAEQPAAPVEGGAARPSAAGPGPAPTRPSVAPTTGPARPKPEAVPQPRPLWPYFVGAGVALVVVVLVAQFVAVKAAAGPPPEPADWGTQQSKTKLLSVLVPGNYKFSTSGSAGTYEQVTVKATKLCRVYVDGNATKGAMSDVSAATARMTEDTGPATVVRSAEGRFHAAQGELHKRKDPSYAEEGQMGEWSFAGMPGAYSEYASVKKVGLLAVRMKGWRLSCMGGDYGYQVWAEAPATQWEEFQPTARKILESAKLNPQN